MEEIISRWTETGPYWEKHRVVICQMFAPASNTAEVLIVAGAKSS